MKCEKCGVETDKSYSGKFGRTLCADCSPRKEGTQDPDKKRSRYKHPRAIAGFVNTLGWLFMIVGPVLFLIKILDGDPFWAAVGLFMFGHGIVFILVSDGLIAVFDIADNSAKALSGMDGLVRLLSDRDQSGGRSGGAEVPGDDRPRDDASGRSENGLPILSPRRTDREG